MEITSSYRDVNRVRLRATLLDAARELTVSQGWQRVRMSDIATAGGVSRQTVYNEFGGRQGLAEALAVAEIQKFVTSVRAILSAHGGDVRAAGYAAIRYVLEEAARNPLVRAILTSGRGGADELLPYLTTRSQLVLDAAGAVIDEWAAVHVTGVQPAVVALAGNSIIRLTVSHIILPFPTPEDSAAELSEVLVRLLR